MAGLTGLQREFVNQYFLCGRNATEAVIRAGYKCKDNRVTAASIGYENLRKPQIKAAIDEQLKEAAMGANEVLFLLSEHARSSFEDFLDAQGRPDIGKARDAGKMHLIKRWKTKKTVTEKTTIYENEIELHDAQSALVQLGRYHKLFTDKVQMLDWRDEAIAAIRANEIDYEAMSSHLGDDLARQLFREAGIPISAAS
jgi:phage terminase small subunit